MISRVNCGMRISVGINKTLRYIQEHVLPIRNPKSAFRNLPWVFRQPFDEMVEAEPDAPAMMIESCWKEERGDKEDCQNPLGIEAQNHQTEQRKSLESRSPS